MKNLKNDESQNGILNVESLDLKGLLIKETRRPFLQLTHFLTKQE